MPAANPGAALPTRSITSPIALIGSSEIENTVLKSCFQMQKDIPTGARSQAGHQPCLAGRYAAARTRAVWGATRVHRAGKRRLCFIFWQSTNPGIPNYSPLPPMMPEGCREGAGDAGRETRAGDPVSAQLERMVLGLWHVHPPDIARAGNGAHIPPRPPAQSTPTCPRHLQQNPRLGQQQRTGSGRRNYFISSPLQGSGIRV